ncbi:flagellar biosynthetic protein FliO [Halomonas sp. WWR20]
MSFANSASQAGDTLNSAALNASQGDSLLGLAVFGKTALSLLLIIGVILLCAWLLKRIGPGRMHGNRHLRVVASTAVGQRERVVIVEVEGSWLVLGVGGGQVNTLHRLETPPSAEREATSPSAANSSFAQRFAQALKSNAGLTLASGRKKPSSDEHPPSAEGRE